MKYNGGFYTFHNFMNKKKMDYPPSCSHEINKEYNIARKEHRYSVTAAVPYPKTRRKYEVETGIVWLAKRTAGTRIFFVFFFSFFFVVSCRYSRIELHAISSRLYFLISHFRLQCSPNSWVAARCTQQLLFTIVLGRYPASSETTMALDEMLIAISRPLQILCYLNQSVSLALHR